MPIAAERLGHRVRLAARQRPAAAAADRALRRACRSRGPSISTSLALRSGGWRHVLVVGRSAESLTGTTVTLALGAQLAAILDGDWLQPPIADGAALVRGLAEEGRRRLLKLFMTTGASLFGRGSPEFAQAARRLAETVAAAPLVPASLVPAGRGWRRRQLPASGRTRGRRDRGADRRRMPTGLRAVGDWQARVETAGVAAASCISTCPARPGGEAALVGLGARASCICARRTQSFRRSRWRPGWRGAAPRSAPGSPGS